MPLEEVLAMSSLQFTYWIEYYRMEPFGPLRDNIHTGIIASQIFNSNRGRSTPAVSPNDFILKNKRQKQESSVSAFIEFLNTAATDE